jgi:ribosomal protein L40E
MAKRTDSILGPVIMLILGGGFVLFWISGASGHGAPAIFPLFGVVFLGILVVTLGGTIFKTLEERSRNQALPVLTRPARVVAKRTELKHHGKSHSTSYYATFDLGPGERSELELNGREYGLVAEGDRGELRYQGSWFLGFHRNTEPEPEQQAVTGDDLVCEYCAALNPPGARKCSSCGSGRLVPRVSAGTES